MIEGCHLSGDPEDNEELSRSNTWFDPEAFEGRGGVRPSFTESDVREVSLLPGVKGVMSLGSVLSVELKPNANTSPVSVPHFQANDSSGDVGPVSANPNTVNKHSRYYNSSASAVVVSLLKQNNVYARPLGNVVYLMPTPMTPEVDRQRLIRVIKRYLHTFIVRCLFRECCESMVSFREYLTVIMILDYYAKLSFFTYLRYSDFADFENNLSPTPTPRQMHYKSVLFTAAFRGPSWGNPGVSSTGLQ